MNVLDFMLLMKSEVILTVFFALLLLGDKP